MLTRRQLIELGLDPHEVDYRRRVGRLVLLHRGVYAVGHRPPSPHARAIAAVLACGDGAVLSHRWAAALWEIGPRQSGPVDVTAPRGRPRGGVRLHRSRSLTRRDVTTHYGIRVTTLARTLLDLADTLPDRALARAVNDAQLKQRSVKHQLAALIARSPGRNTSRLRRFVEDTGSPTRSVFEDAFVACVEHHGLPRPELNQRVAGHEVDAYWPRHGLAVELDSRTHHGTDLAFEIDRDRDVDVLIAGVPVVRLTWRRFTSQPNREALRLATLLGRRD